VLGVTCERGARGARAAGRGARARVARGVLRVPCYVFGVADMQPLGRGTTGDSELPRMHTWAPNWNPRTSTRGIPATLHAPQGSNTESSTREGAGRREKRRVQRVIGSQQARSSSRWMLHPGTPSTQQGSVLFTCCCSLLLSVVWAPASGSTLTHRAARTSTPARLRTPALPVRAPGGACHSTAAAGAAAAVSTDC